jgi:hypothetical protein
MLQYFLCIVIAFLISILFEKRRKQKRKNLEIIEYSELMNAETPFSLFLRAFEDDGKRKKPPSSLFTLGLSGLHSFEEEISFHFKNKNLIAVGKPNETFPQLGAKRLYLEDDLWKNHVSSLAQRTKVIIIKPSFTDGLFWELAMIEENAFWNKTVFYHMFKDDEDFETQKFYYNAFKKMLFESFAIELQEYSKKSKFSYFTSTKTHVQVKSLKDIPYLNKENPE